MKEEEAMIDIKAPEVLIDTKQVREEEVVEEEEFLQSFNIQEDHLITCR
jgi:hypothetical protein